MDIYRVFSLLIPIIPNITIPHITQTTTTIRSIGHSSSAYSFEVTVPVKKDATARARIITYSGTISFATVFRNLLSASETFKVL